LSCDFAYGRESNPDPHRTKREVKKIDLFLTTFAQSAYSSRNPSGTQWQA
jgi:hypothetical protein